MHKISFVFFCFFSLNLFAQNQNMIQYYPFGKGEKWGIINSEREVVSKPKYDSIGFFNDIDRPGTTADVKKKGKLGLIDIEGKIILKPKYDEISTAGYHARDFMQIRKGDSWGLVNRTTGELKLKVEYEEIGQFYGLKKAAAVIKKDGKYGVYSLEKGMLTPFEYDKIVVYDEWDRAAFELQKGDEISYVDNDGNKTETLPLEEEMPAFVDQTLEEAPTMAPSPEITKIKDQQFAIQFLYNMRAPQGYKRYRDTIIGYDKVLKIRVSADRHSENSDLPIFHIVVEKDGKKGMLGKDGKVMTLAEYDDFENAKESREYIYLIKGNLKGVAQKHSGQKCLDALFTKIRLNNTGLFFVEHQNGYFGYANSRGDIFLPEY